jgi:hydroxymethylglutaryl-CoA lyase
MLSKVNLISPTIWIPISIKRPVIRLLSKDIPNSCSKKVNIIEVCLRDGIQNEKKVLSTLQKVDLIEHILYSGIKEIEYTSFVDPKKVPQFYDSVNLTKSLPNYSKATFSALVPNIKGYTLGVTDNKTFLNKNVNVNEIVLFVSCTETFNKKNINASISEAFERFKPIAEKASKDSKSIRGSISCCFGCPYEGDVKVEQVEEIIKRYKDLGVDRIDIADTIGCGTRNQIYNIINKAINYFDVSQLTGHYHDVSQNTVDDNVALQLVDESLKCGMRTFHSSIGGIGACPFSSKKVGNLDTIKLVKFLKKEGYQIDVNEEELNEISKKLKSYLIN